MNKVISHTYIPSAMIKRPTMKYTSDTKTDSQHCIPAMNSSKILKALVYRIIPHIKKSK